MPRWKLVDYLMPIEYEQEFDCEYELVDEDDHEEIVIDYFDLETGC